MKRTSERDAGNTINNLQTPVENPERFASEWERIFGKTRVERDRVRREALAECGGQGVG
jgi:hypothetical protein